MPAVMLMAVLACANFGMSLGGRVDDMMASYNAEGSKTAVHIIGAHIRKVNTGASYSPAL